MASREKLQIAPGAAGAVWRYVYRGIQHQPHRHAELELNLVERGTSHYVLDERRYDIGPGALVWLFPRQDHVMVNPSADLVMWIVVFRPWLVRDTARATGERPLRSGAPAGRFCRFLQAPAARRIAAVCQDLADAQQHGQLGRLNHGLAYLLLSAWAGFCDAALEPVSRGIHPAVERAAHLIRQEGSRPDRDVASVVALARRAGLSAGRLSHLFHLQTGMTLSAFRAQCRLERFLELLAASSRPNLLRCALRAGFGSYAQFHRVFRSRMGCGPREYLRIRSD